MKKIIKTGCIKLQTIHKKISKSRYLPILSGTKISHPKSCINRLMRFFFQLEVKVLQNYNFEVKIFLVARTPSTIISSPWQMKSEKIIWEVDWFPNQGTSSEDASNRFPKMRKKIRIIFQIKLNRVLLTNSRAHSSLLQNIFVTTSFLVLIALTMNVFLFNL